MKTNNKCYSWLMIIGCLAPFVISITLPFFGVKSDYVTWFIVLTGLVALSCIIITQKALSSSSLKNKTVIKDDE